MLKERFHTLTSFILATSILLFVVCAVCPAQTSGYGYARAITIDHRQVAKSDQTDFPVLLTGTFPFLATSTNGGRVQNSSGYDIIFTSDAAGQNQLDHEIDSYDALTGTAAFWIRIPSLSHLIDTPIYIWYGNSSVSVSQEHKAGVWRNGYLAVWHLGSGVSSTAVDSTGNNNATAVGSVSAVAGRIGGAAGVNGSANNYLRVASTAQTEAEFRVNARGLGQARVGRQLEQDLRFGLPR